MISLYLFRTGYWVDIFFELFISNLHFNFAPACLILHLGWMIYTKIIIGRHDGYRDLLKKGDINFWNKLVKY